MTGWQHVAEVAGIALIVLSGALIGGRYGTARPDTRSGRLNASLTRWPFAVFVVAIAVGIVLLALAAL